MIMNRVSEDFKSEVLLVMLEGLSILLRGNFSEESFHRAIGVWKKILYDFSTLYFGEGNALPPLLKEKPRVYRIGRLYRASGFKGRFLCAVPFIRLSGIWLENFGFDIGERFAVYSFEDQLILKRFSYHKHVSENLGDWTNG
ncbi:MAG: type I toxin-antitoxin system SymE family toxin [Planctomycetes bacterium]|nr:type I toxin-antitoxin system SymE family toxin [Planctomycetota bacterium]